MSTTNRSGQAAYDAMLGWFGGCSDARVQLISTYDVGRVGDAAQLWCCGRGSVPRPRWSLASRAPAAPAP